MAGLLTITENELAIGLLAIFGEVESTGTSTREMERLLLGNGTVFLPSHGQANVARPPNNPVSPNVTKSR
jgi:hypothetical protein